MDAFEIIRATMKEFENVSDDEVKIYIELSEQLISESKFGRKYPQALACLAAHRMKMTGLGETTGAGTIGSSIGLSSVTEGETSVSFSNSQVSNTSSDSEYGLTSYGMQFLQLRRSCIITIVSAGVMNNGR